MSHEDTSLVSPSTGDVAHGVATTTENQRGQTEALDVAHAVSVAIHAQIEATQTITRQTVTATLQDNSFGLVILHDVLDNGLENGFVGLVSDTVSQRVVDRVVFAASDTNVAKLTSTREVLSVLVERDRHDTIGCVESLLDTVSMVNVNIDVEDSFHESQKFEDTEYDI